MSCKKNLTGLVYGVAVSALALAPLAANAQGDMSAGSTTTTTTGTTTMGTGTMGTGTMDSSMSGTTMDMNSSGMTGSGMMMSDQPMLVTGTVLRYYVDRAGYVTAMDVQTPSGVQFVRFSAGMGQRLYSTYPVGGQASVYVVGSQAMGMTRMDVVGMGAKMPAPGTMMMTQTVSDAELLDTTPYIQAGQKLVTVRGKLRDLITNDQGEIVGIVLGSKESMMRKKMMKETMSTPAMMTNMARLMMMSAEGKMMPVTMANGTASVGMSDGTSVDLAKDAGGAYVVPESMTGARMVMSAPDGTMMDIDTQNGQLMARMADGSMAPVGANGMMMMPGMMTTTTTMMPMMTNAMMGGILVRVPRELRHIAPGYAGTERVTPLFRGAEVEVTGYPESPRYGVLSTFDKRISANTLVVNGRAVGAIGVPMMSKEATKSLLKFNLGGNSKSADEMKAATMGYTPYGTGAQMGTGGAMMDSSGTMSTTTGTSMQ